MTSWKLTARASREVVEAALTTHGAIDEWPGEFVVGASEVAEHPCDWLLEAWLTRRPTRADTAQLRDLFADADPKNAPEIIVEKLPETDWVTASQMRTEPVRAGPFRIRTPDFPPLEEAGLIEFEIPAAQAFGTGQHATTAGCLEMLASMKRRGIRPRTIADIGTGTGLLAFAALALWPRARVTASDIDPLCAAALIDNAARNAVVLGDGRGELAFAIAAGLEADLHAANAPYDLIIANILAGPLIDLAPAIAAASTPRGQVVLSGLLTTQERAVRNAYLRAGFLQMGRLVRGDWSILWLRRRSRAPFA